MIRTTKARLFVFFAAAMVLWIAPHTKSNAQAEDPQGSIELDQTSFAATAWRSDGTHITAIKGKLTFGDQPVANALLQVKPQGRNIVTQEDGSFELLVDRSLIAYKPVLVVSVQNAKIAGKPIENKAADSILAASAKITVYHPIEVTKVAASETDASRVKVHARFIIGKDDKISFFQVYKYRISGTVEDADGRPVKDAIVWIDRDSGEGFAKSTKADRNGRYEMYYWPEEDETNLTVIVGKHRYTLPGGKVFHFPRDTSVDIQIRLPREGFVIDDEPSNLVCTTAPGAKYSGLLAGLDVPPGTPYTVTIPDRQGRFVLTVPKDVWEKRPLFFETMSTKFVAQDKILKAGDELPDGFVQPGNQDPTLPAAVR
ncbi:carboxypeptidase-like regulatory domain-containing protein [Paenibacillus kobensis]|uniref:carboxypeptidase-like regulatory domain-containing protein n=1 Tax=Paenibacillus kobensis TaxID=59841 RepID=UPI0013E39B8F|nr:carboxypeptidase-like regulatory domain-containing protein [Paenibacillus kobensis]